MLGIFISHERETPRRGVAMDSRKTSIAKHRERNIGLNGGHLWERDYSLIKSSPVSVEKIQTSCAGILLYIIADS
ncbi:hypothetical protein Zmor_027903 [Zophobas morio]|uniref:Uncharacterized protein n=1 Tax=Zophobas morio TaxID=2755281 RepID=A0AA38M2H2_9CUCU|nr:hypothetical protein Zmor_027903 [Zophobas morio]